MVWLWVAGNCAGGCLSITRCSTLGVMFACGAFWAADIMDINQVLAHLIGVAMHDEVYVQYSAILWVFRPRHELP